MVRGINKANIFDKNEDKACFLERLEQNVTDGKCSVYAWVLKTNYVFPSITLPQSILDQMPKDYQVKGELTGPAYSTPMQLSTTPGKPFSSFAFRALINREP